MTYQEKLTTLANRYGISEDAYFEMIKNEVVIDGMITWAWIVFALLALILSIMVCRRFFKNDDDSLGELMLYVITVVLLINIATIFVTDTYKSPLNETFNTEYIVMQKINDMTLDEVVLEESEDEE